MGRFLRDGHDEAEDQNVEIFLRTGLYRLVIYTLGFSALSDNSTRPSTSTARAISEQRS
jgi:hypothetical protein